MTVIDEYVVYNQQFKVFICQQHGYAVKLSFIKRHFRRTHKSISLDDRQRIVEYSEGLSLVEPEDLEIPLDTPAAIIGLPITESLQCIECRFFRKRMMDMLEHCRHKHGWEKGQTDMWETKKVQTFYQGAFQKYDYKNMH
jgi:Orsellinic acid/F9775 biosynthesis cluster protein D